MNVRPWSARRSLPAQPATADAPTPADLAAPGAGPAPADRLRGAWRFVARGPGRMAVPGFLGVVIMVFGGFGSGALRRQDPLLDTAFLSWLRYGHGKVLSGALVYLGLVLMFYSWVRIGRAVRAGRFTPAQLGGLAVAWAAPMLLSVPLFSRDVYSYLAQGALLRDGFDPYAVGPAVNPGPLLDNVSTVWTTTTAPYGPAFILIARGVTMITGDDVVTGTMAMRLVMLPGLALLLWAVPRLARNLGGSPAVAMWVAVLNPLVLAHLIGGVHNELLMVGLLTAGIVAVLERRHLLGVAVISLAVAVKATAGAALPFMVWIWMRHRRDDARARGAAPPPWIREFLRTAAPSVLVFSAVFTAATMAAGIGVGWMTALSGADKIINWLSLPTAVAQLYTAATSWFTGIGLEPVLDITRLFGEAALAVIVVLLVARYRNSVHEAIYGALYAMVAILLLSPQTLPWYYTWPLAVVSGLVVSGRSMSWVAAFSVFMMLIFRPDGSIGMYQWYHVLLCAGCAAVAAVALHREDPLRLRRLRSDAPAPAAADAAGGPAAAEPHGAAPAAADTAVGEAAGGTRDG